MGKKSREKKERKDPGMKKAPGLRGVTYNPEIMADVTPEEILAAKEFAAKSASKVHSGLVLSLADHRAHMGRANEECALGRVQALGDTEGPEAEQVRATALLMLVEALVDQGRLDEALAIDPSHGDALDHHAAREMADDHFECGCTDDSPISRWYYVEVISAKHGGAVRQWRCPCGFKNTTHSTPPSYETVKRSRISEAALLALPRDEWGAHSDEVHFRGSV